MKRKAWEGGKKIKEEENGEEVRKCKDRKWERQKRIKEEGNGEEERKLTDLRYRDCVYSV